MSKQPQQQTPVVKAKAVRPEFPFVIAATFAGLIAAITTSLTIGLSA